MRKKRAVKNFVATFALQVVSVICGLVLPKLIIKTFGSDVNGLINSITQFLAYIMLLESGFGPVILASLYKPIAKQDRNTILKILKSSESFFKKIAIIFVAYILILCVIYPIFVNSSFDSFFTISLILIISISTFAEYFFGLTYRLFLQAEQKKYIISLINLITMIINAILIYILILLKFNIHIVKLVSSLIFVLRPVLQNLYVKKKYSIDLSKISEKAKIEQKWDGLAQHIAGVIFSNTDVTLLSFINLKEVSVYGIYNSILSSIRNFISILSGSVEAGFGDMIAKNEKDNLNKKFGIYEFLYLTLITIIYSCAATLIIPFVRVYTKDIVDANYIRETFSIIISFSFFIHAIKSLYNNLAYSAGKFKETHVGAWVEAITNLVLSVVLVFKYGLIGVAIGTLVSVSIRCVEFLIFTSKKILDRKVIKSTIRVSLSIIEFFVIYFLCTKYIDLSALNYIMWIKNAIFVFSIASLVTLFLNAFIYKKQYSVILNYIISRVRGNK